jgi:predicted ATPase
MQSQKLKKVQITGFRSLKNVVWEPDSLNVLIGPNGSGKSNLLRGLELIRESAAAKLRDSILDDGGFRQLLWDHRAVELAWRLELIPEFMKRTLIYDLALRGQVTQGGFYIDREVLADCQHAKPGTKGETFNLIERDASHAAIFDAQKRKLVALPETLDDDRTALSERFPFGTPRIRTFAAAVRLFHVYHDLQTHRKASVREAAVARVEKSLSSDGQNLVPVLHTLYSGDRDFKNSIDAGMRAAFGKDFEDLVFGPAADQKVQLRIRWRSLKDPVSSADLSDGTLRFLMLLAILANPEPFTVVAIDEPETGLHPRMFPIIAEFAASASEHSTVVLTTHSPEFLDAFPPDCIPTTTVAECVEGETKLSKLDPGELNRWLKEYSLGKLFRSGELEALS